MKKYQPSNGSEGCAFTSKFCDRCKKQHIDLGCDIQLDTMIYDIYNDGYPEEWTYDTEGNPTCTAFQRTTMKKYICPECGNEEDRQSGFWLARCSECETEMEEVEEKDDN